MKSTSMNPTRRQFLRTSAMTAALAGIARPFHILRAQDVSPNSKLRFAMIGPGGMGIGDFGAALGTRLVDCLAICDVYRPNAGYYARHGWPVWCDFACGPIAGMGSHTLSALHYGVGLPYPEKIEPWVSNKGTLTFPGQSRLTFHLPASGGRPAFKLFWYDGKDNLPARPEGWDAEMPFPPGKPEDWDDSVSHFPSNAGGALVIGSKASVILHDIWGLSCHIFPRAKFAELRPSLPPKTIPRYKGHHVQNWVDAITKKIPASSAPFELAGHGNNLCMLGSVATRVNRTLNFDPTKKECTGDAAATAMLRHAGGYEARGGFPG